ncbi:MAG: hypothetical protein L0221_03490, partial [Chloroflexi bacterium]|nr:hypothetical protein [Chloroflexota bacterium]
MSDNETRAYVAQNATVDANGDVRIAANQDTEIDTIAGQGGLSLSSSSGGVANSTIVHLDTVEAYIGQDAQVTGRGNTAGQKGVEVEATSTEDLKTIAAGASVSADSSGLGIGGSVNVNVLDEDTKAWIASGADVNASLVGAAAGQDVRVSASDDTEILSIAGAVQYGGSGGLGAGVDVGVITKDTYAYVADTAIVKAKDDIAIGAESDEDTLSVAANLGISGSGFAVGITASVYVVNTETLAYVDDAGFGNASLQAGGDLTLSADDTAEFMLFAGTVAIGGGSAGVGVSNTTLVHNDTVEAYIGGGSSVTARGATGVTVSATSSESLLMVAAAGSGGSSAGVAGSAVVNVLDEETHAFIGDGAHV